jgi:hypothetical protein
VGVADWELVASQDHLSGGSVYETHPGSAWLQGDAVAFGADGTVYVSVGDDHNGNDSGDLYMGSGLEGGSWTKISDNAWKSGTSNNRIPALGVGKNGAGDAIVLAAVDGTGAPQGSYGIFRGIVSGGSAVWSRINGTSGAGGQISWPVAAQGSVYVSTPSAVFCSANAGQTLAQVGTAGALGVAADPTAPARFYVIAPSKNLLAYTQGCASASSTQLGLGHPAMLIATGPDGTLFAVTDTVPREIYRCESVPCGGSSGWENIGDLDFEELTPKPSSLAVGSDNYLYVAIGVKGVAVGVPY